VKLTPDVIYDAAIDDALFAELPGRLAAAFQARSCVLHWRDQSGAAEISTHSGYFSDADMANYAENFVEHDLWTDAGMRQGFVNKAWRVSDLVPATSYERSIFYNEWIRSMGDDTFHCCGSVMQTPHGAGIIGLHRGKGQTDFSNAVLADLNRNVAHLRRMFAIRARLEHVTARQDLLGAVFSAGHEAAFAVSFNGRILMANDQGDLALRAQRLVKSVCGQLQAVDNASRTDLEAAIALAGKAETYTGSTCLLRAGNGEFAIASVLPLSSLAYGPAILVTLQNAARQLPEAELARHLRQAFGLSGAETAIALLLASGRTLNEISDIRGSAIGTVRTQVKAIMLKLGARRQGDVVRIVGQFGGPAASSAAG